MNKNSIIIILLAIQLIGANHAAAEQNNVTTHPPYMGNGIKIGEITPNSVIIWTRLTKIPEYKIDGADFIQPKTTQDRPDHQIPVGKTMADMNTSLPGMEGEVQLSYWPSAVEQNKITTKWIPVAVDQDFTRQFILRDLIPATRYSFIVQGRAHLLQFRRLINLPK